MSRLIAFCKPYGVLCQFRTDDDTPTLSNYISIQISDTWGSGDVTINGTDVSIPQYWGLISINARNYIEVKGTSSNRLRIINSPQLAFMSQGTSGTHQLGIKLRYMDFDYSSGYSGLNFSYSDSFEVRDCTANHNQYVGFGIGGGSDQNCDNGKFYDCEAYHNGDSGGGSVHGFGLYGCTNIEYWRCTSHSNHRDGFDFGTTSNTNNASAKLVDCTSYSNGEDGFAFNGGTAGQRTGYYINCISYDNGQSGFDFYSGGVTVYVYHCLAHNNHFNLISYDEDGSLDVNVYVKNSIFYKPSNYCNIWEYDVDHEDGTKYYSDYNLWVQESSEYFAQIEDYPPDENYIFISYNGTTRPSNWNAESYGWLPDTSQDDDNSGWNQDPAFVDVNNHDYHPTESSWTIGKGVYISDPIEAAIDKDGVARLNPPTIGPYEFVESDTIPPADVTNFAAIAGDAHVSLTWTNPGDSDFVGTMIRYSTEDYPLTHNDGTPVPNGNEGRFLNDPNSNDGFVHSGLQNGTTYYYSAFTYDEVPNYSETAHASATPIPGGPPPDEEDPTVAITSPTSEDTYSTSQNTIDLSGSASDNVGVISVTWVNNRGGSGTASGTDNWTISGITLYCGEDNIVTVTARDAAGNTDTDTLAVKVPPCAPKGLIRVQ